MMEIVWRLDQVMRRRGITGPTALAERLADIDLPLSRAQLSRLARHAPRRITLGLVAALCEVLECELDELLQLVADPRTRRLRRKQHSPPEAHL